MHGVVIVIEAVPTIAGHHPNGVLAPVVSLPRGREHDLLHAVLVIADLARAGQRGAGQAAVERHGGVVRVLQLLELGPAFQAQSFHLSLHDLRGGREVARRVERLEAALQHGD